MLLINNLAAPGEIRRVEIRAETIKVTTRDGKERIYKIISTNGGVDKM